MTRMRVAGGRPMDQFFGNRRIALYSSGTAALSRAIRDCAALSHKTAPEVIIPAYGCPDLVAACLHASVFPRLVDVSPDVWGYSQPELERCATKQTVAIVAVNLLGAGDGAAELSLFCRSREISLIQDSAQHLPRTATDWPGNYIVLSFGRGKPLNLLSGGALVSAEARDSTMSAVPHRFPLKDRLLASRFAAAGFNWLTRPWLYGLLSTLPGTGLGSVVYKVLDNESPLPDRARSRVGAAFEQYLRGSSYRRDLWAPVLGDWQRWGIEELRSNSPDPEEEPLRLALLAPDLESRDDLVAALVHEGLGASRFYGTELSRITGIPESVQRQGPFPNARRLAARLFTLPTHTLVTTDVVRATHEIVRQWHHRRRTTLTNVSPRST